MISSLGVRSSSPTFQRLSSQQSGEVDENETPIYHNPLISNDNRERNWWVISWLLMLNRELSGSFVFGIIVIYGFGQGLGGAINKVVVDYYWKDVQGAQPSAVQLYRGFSAIPWDIKPIWGILTDIVPMGGYHRRPYFLISGLLASVGTIVLVTGGKLWVPMAVGMLVLIAVGAALSDATIDAEVARKSQLKATLAADIQSLCAISQSVGSLLGFLSSGPSVDILGAKGALGLMGIPTSLLLILGFVLHEKDDSITHASQFWSELWSVTQKLWVTLKQSRVWKPTLFMYLSISICPDISEGKFYWYTSATDGPGFSEEFVGAIYATGAIGTLAAVYMYHKKLKRVSFRWILFWVQFLVAVFGMLDFILVTRLNRKLGIPDKIFVVGDEGMTQALSRLKWIPLLILAAKLCPPGIEGTFFAFLMSVDNVGMLTSTWLGAALLQVTKVSRDSFRFLWLAVMIRNILRLVPLFLIFLLPNTDPEEDIFVQNDQNEDIQLVVTTLSPIENGLGIQSLS